ncbi:YggS family pyridoxal phosphate-dependent enzyme [Enterococcus raffinosus]|uniref:Pyridoxal phosphate homeostasis protein n=1 Tax=Enterococcus raffinosus ATCC 49464 TaxID=1158602 RepID=R2NYP8_9ENTE|nr:YggS family pyridoxal phosphate-dependent enzyme [Enterococcus raffinosus]EOH77142.1 YggS family pyridoxal phosphate enzyme [Enterococcus raffinosus ATCC 49464]EOT75835.1 YggS family pyridoxal phosphate enzyme [Enterococcus raffinosus ATCC 49464]UXK03233.1 YggS family pyridoxal phosphate-dependent enzyme [Enterococcus raffinosus]
MIAENLHKIEQEIQESCALVSRNPKDVTMVAVTKSVDSKTASELVELGILDLAENRVDKLLDKKQSLSQHQQIKWHLIGNLQRRKVKLIINEIDYFHALDSLRLAQEIQKRAEHQIDCFIEINVSGEESKHGLNPAELHSFIQEIAGLDKIRVIGLMTMAPYEASEQEVRTIFSTLKDLQESVKKLNLQYAPCTELSMGMSQDFKTAIEEGATFVRIGTALFRKG